MSSTSTQSSQGERVPSRRLWRVGLAAIVITVIVNVLIRTLAVTLFAISPAFGPLGLGPTIAFTIAGVLGATLVFALVSRRTRRPIRLFRILAGIVLVVTLIPDIALLFGNAFPGTTVLAVSVLMVEHIITAAIAVGVLTARGRVEA